YKRGKATEHTLIPAIADALVRYLRTERSGDEDDEFVFLRQCPPHVRMSPSAVAYAVRRYMRFAGVEPHGPHSLRHAFACRQLRNSRSLKTIADLLGHRSLGAVAIYAKVDHPRLRGGRGVAGGSTMIRFTSWLAPYFRRFVQLKRAGAASFDTQEQLMARS
ncbi:MAG: tyrosine-type recombinase/integrase, partial [Mycobacteriales bacterium]